MYTGKLHSHKSDGIGIRWTTGTSIENLVIGHKHRRQDVQYRRQKTIEEEEKRKGIYRVSIFIGPDQSSNNLCNKRQYRPKCQSNLIGIMIIQYHNNQHIIIYLLADPNYVLQ